MEKKLFILAIFTLFISCEVTGELTPNRENLEIPPTSKLLYFGDFSPTSGITVSGTAKIYLNDNNHQLVLENFSISDGPDLKVYLSKSATPNEYINLGNLTSATVYNIPSEVNLSDYKFVLIHCQQHNHLFAVATLIEN